MKKSKHDKLSGGYLDNLFKDALNDYHKIFKSYKKASQQKIDELSLEAVKSQIEWASRVYVKNKDSLNKTETDLLKKVIDTGKYLESDRGLLNELLEKYHYVKKIKLGKI